MTVSCVGCTTLASLLTALSLKLSNCLFVYSLCQGDDKNGVSSAMQSTCMDRVVMLYSVRLLYNLLGYIYGIVSDDSLTRCFFCFLFVCFLRCCLTLHSALWRRPVNYRVGTKQAMICIRSNDPRRQPNLLTKHYMRPANRLLNGTDSNTERPGAHGHVSAGTGCPVVRGTVIRRV